MSHELFGIKAVASKNADHYRSSFDKDSNSNPESYRSDSSSTLTNIDTQSEIIGIAARNSECDKDRNSLQDRPNAKKIYTVRSTKASRAREELNRKKEAQLREANNKDGASPPLPKPRLCKVPSTAQTSLAPSECNLSKNTVSGTFVKNTTPVEKKSSQEINKQSDDLLLKMPDICIKKKPLTSVRTEFKDLSKLRNKSSMIKNPIEYLATKEKLLNKGDTEKPVASKRRKDTVLRPRTSLAQHKQVANNDNSSVQNASPIKNVSPRRVVKSNELDDHLYKNVAGRITEILPDKYQVDFTSLKSLGDAEHFQQRKLDVNSRENSVNDNVAVKKSPREKFPSSKKQKTSNLPTETEIVSIPPIDVICPVKQFNKDSIPNEKELVRSGLEHLLEFSTIDSVASLKETLIAKNLSHKKLETQCRDLTEELQGTKTKLKIAETALEHLKSQQQSQLSNLSKRVSEVDELMTSAIAEREMWKSRAVELGKQLKNQSLSAEKSQEKKKNSKRTVGQEKNSDVLHIHEDTFRSGCNGKKHKTIKILKTVKKLHLTPEMYEKMCYVRNEE